MLFNNYKIIRHLHRVELFSIMICDFLGNKDKREESRSVDDCSMFFTSITACRNLKLTR